MPPMIRIATLANGRFREPAGNLLTSLKKSGNDFHLTIYCDDEMTFDGLRGPRCDLVHLPEILRLGPKRAKLTAFAAATRTGSVLFLDADAIVVDNLEEFWGGPEILGCPDTLEYCRFIADPEHPWPLAPSLRNTRYINSGAFFAPAETAEFFEEVHLASLDDEVWRRYSWATLDENFCRLYKFDGSLDDNHFLCAFLNLRDQPVGLLDPTAFGWRGFLKDGRLQVYRVGQSLLNVHTHRPLKLVIFAGVQQTPELLNSLPAEIARLIAERTDHVVQQQSTAALATLEGRLHMLREECRRLGDLPPQPPTLRGTMGKLLIMVVRRLLSWYMPRLDRICTGLVDVIDGLRGVVRGLHDEQLALRDEIRISRLERDHLLHDRMNALEARVQTLWDRRST